MKNQCNALQSQEMFARDVKLESLQNEENQMKLDTEEDNRLCKHVAFCVRDGNITGLTKGDKSAN